MPVDLTSVGNCGDRTVLLLSFRLCQHSADLCFLHHNYHVGLLLHCLVCLVQAIDHSGLDVGDFG